MRFDLTACGLYSALNFAQNGDAWLMSNPLSSIG